MDARRNRTLRIPGLVIGLALLAAACGGGASAATGGPTLKIVAPTSGASISEPFTVKLQASVPLGDPSTGEDHVHLCFDGASCDSNYKLVYGNSIQISDLSPGRHTMEASLRNADHSDTGVSASVSFTVSSSGSSSTGTSSGSGSGSSSGGYGYGSG